MSESRLLLEVEAFKIILQEIKDCLNNLDESPPDQDTISDLVDKIDHANGVWLPAVEAIINTKGNHPDVEMRAALIDIATVMPIYQVEDPYLELVAYAKRRAKEGLGLRPVVGPLRRPASVSKLPKGTFHQ